MYRSPISWISLVLFLAGCALPSERGDDYRMALMRERQAAAIAQARSAQLEAEVAIIRAKLAEREQLDLALRREQILMSERLDRLLELQERTYRAVAENPNGIADYKELPTPAPAAHQVEMKAIVRTIERLSLNPEQKQAIIQMFHAPRQLDSNNPWGKSTEWK